tara:strand:+ start:320 stop:487 length:168 start_codon:yes stop_codon:yes gene_type:complete
MPQQLLNIALVLATLTAIDEAFLGPLWVAGLPTALSAFLESTDVWRGAKQLLYSF